MTDETRAERGDLPGRRVVGEAISALSAALAAAAATVVVLAWVETWGDVRQLSLATYLFWPVAVAAMTLWVGARRIRHPADRSETEESSTERRGG